MYVVQHSAKNPSAGPFVKFFAECHGPDTRQRNYIGAQVLVVCPSFEWLAVQMSIFRRNSNKRTKSSSYRKHFYNCPKMVHIGLHSVGTYHKKFGWQKRKKKNVLCRVSRNDTRQSILCRVSAGWHSGKKHLCRVPKLGARQKLTDVSYRRLLTALCRAPPSPSVWHSAMISLPSVFLCRESCSRQTWSLPRAGLCRVRYSAKASLLSARQKALGKATDSGSDPPKAPIRLYGA
jgi:hypothetical protein